jgi:hypothetical protein
VRAGAAEAGAVVVAIAQSVRNVPMHLRLLVPKAPLTAKMA